MELIAKVKYNACFFSLEPGQSTEGLDIPEELKRSILADHPDWFEVIGGEKKAEAVKVVETLETPEDGLKIETPEERMSKRKK